MESPKNYQWIYPWWAGFTLLLSFFFLGAFPLGQKLAAQAAQTHVDSLSARGPFEGQGGIRVKARSILFGSARHCRAPATIDFKQVLDATPEMQQIQEDQIPKGSARYIILVAKAVKRIRKAVGQVAVAEKRDCVVKAGSIRENPKNLEVVDLTDKVIESLEDVEIGD